MLNTAIMTEPSVAGFFHASKGIGTMIVEKAAFVLGAYKNYRLGAWRAHAAADGLLQQGQVQGPARRQRQGPAVQGHPHGHVQDAARQCRQHMGLTPSGWICMTHKGKSRVRPGWLRCIGLDVHKERKWYSY